MKLLANDITYELQDPNTKLFSVWLSSQVCFFEIVQSEMLLNLFSEVCSLKIQQVADSCNGRAEVANTPVSQVALAPVEPAAAGCHWQHQSPSVVWSQQA